MSDRRTRLADVMRAECAGTDLCEGVYGLHVMAQDSRGRVYELGSVSLGLVLLDPQAARAAIEQIKFREGRSA